MKISPDIFKLWQHFLDTLRPARVHVDILSGERPNTSTISPRGFA